MADLPNDGFPANDGAGDDENVDQYFDDGGETFLPADHVSTIQILHLEKLFNRFIFSHWWQGSKTPWLNNWRMNMSV